MQVTFCRLANIKSLNWYAQLTMKTYMYLLQCRIDIVVINNIITYTKVWKSTIIAKHREIHNMFVLWTILRTSNNKWNFEALITSKKLLSSVMNKLLTLVNNENKWGQDFSPTFLQFLLFASDTGIIELVAKMDKNLKI